MLLSSLAYNTSNTQHSYSTTQGHGETEDRCYMVAGDQHPSHVGIKVFRERHVRDSMSQPFYVSNQPMLK